MKRAAFVLTLATTLPFANADEELKPLVVEYPPPFLMGTPVPINLPNLEDASAKAPDILVPADISNLARDKPVTSSDDFPIIGELEYATDGDKESDDGYFVELASGQQWIQIDLEKEAEIYAVAVWRYHAQKRAYQDVVIKVSNDPEFKDGVTTIFNNDHDDSSGFGKGAQKAFIETNQGRLVPAHQAKARYVRLYSNGNTSNEMNHYIEVEVYGR